MKTANVVNLGEIRDLQAAWESVLSHIRAADVTSFHLTLRGAGGRETIYTGGFFKDPAEALRATLRTSIAKMYDEDEPLRVPRLVNDK